MAKKAVVPASRAKGAALVPGAIVEHRQLDPDEQFVANAGKAVVEFFRGLAGFFTTAKALEDSALAMQARALGMQLPATADEDERLQQFIKTTSTLKRDVEAHWTITSTVSQFHRRLTARRAKATDACEAANTRANTLHNTYVANERRRAQIEEDRRRREAEEQAQRDRDAELARMEAEAVKREEASGELSTRELAFVIDVAERGTSAQLAAQRAGYKDPVVQAARLMSSAKIQKAIKARREAAAIRRQAAAVKEQPVDVQVETVAPAVTRAAGTYSRTTYSAQLTNGPALVNAILAGEPGIPRDLLIIDERVLNAYARDLKEQINKWPGVRLVVDTKVI